FTIFVSASLLFFSCNGKNNNANTGKENNSANASTPNASSSADASFSYKIDGHVFSGTGTDNYFNCVEKKPGGLLHFSLTTLDFSVKGPPQFHFQVAENGIRHSFTPSLIKVTSVYCLSFIPI
ncbi:MAG: hypothetical protein ACRDE8_01700, partial [Ginsengibacter sp.]